ncbi:OsmC family protein [Zobellia nedashkovskayae]|uniref:OsmC family protein n=1 Tax=Zobellia nedashkovskayae TaxID=2779510 RepID=UPI00188C40C5|nr:OsmC family protein [Zobellia nedashkovskayae]
MKKSKKVVLVIASIIGVIAIAGFIYWFSMPSEERNMILFMMEKGETYTNYQEYQVIDRNEDPLAPASFKPSVAQTIDGAVNRNIVAITEMVKNENSKMLKKGMMQSTGIDDYTGWHLIADEGAAEGSNPFGPSPLSYYTSGLAANLHTQILWAAGVKGVMLDNIKVEVLNKFRWHNMMSPDGAGFVDETTTNIILQSSASKEVIQEIKEMALSSWTAGEGLRNETVIEPTLVVNGENWEKYHATPGTSLSEESFVDGFKLSSITEIPKKPEYLKPVVKDDGVLGFDTMANMEFEIFAIAESVENKERPYLKKITVSTPTPETWEIYSDEFIGDNDSPLAPTSLEYFTAGTALCLTSQTTLVSAMMGLEFTDYRVEDQIDYRQETIDSTKMVGNTDTVHSYVLIESNESQERLERFYNKSLALCFAGEGLKNATEMNTTLYLNGKEIK